MKPDEMEIARRLLEDANAGVSACPKDYIGDMHPKRLAYICCKWSDKGWYDYGVNCLRGWLTPNGVSALNALLADPETSPSSEGLCPRGNAADKCGGKGT